MKKDADKKNGGAGKRDTSRGGLRLVHNSDDIPVSPVEPSPIGLGLFLAGRNDDDPVVHPAVFNTPSVHPPGAIIVNNGESGGADISIITGDGREVGTHVDHDKIIYLIRCLTDTLWHD